MFLEFFKTSRWHLYKCKNMKSIKEKCRALSRNLINDTKPVNAMFHPININVKNYLNKGNFMWFHVLRCIKPL